MKEQQFTVDTPTDFEPVIHQVLEQLSVQQDTAAVITLTGDLGAGKTTFTQQLAARLGVTEPVVSPTFGIMKRYELFDHPLYDQLVHIDAYRIEDISEVAPLRFAELFQTPRTLMCVEWPEHIAQVIPEQKISISIMLAEGETRKVTVSWSPSVLLLSVTNRNSSP